MAKRHAKKKGKKKKKGAKKVRHHRRKRAVAPDPPPPPFALHGAWKVKRVTVQPPTTTIGVKANNSKFTIEDGNVLRKTANVAWNANNPGPIQLTVTPANDIDRNQNIVLKAKVDIGGQQFELGIGSDDTGVTLKLQLVPSYGEQVQPGGTGTAGRGG